MKFRELFSRPGVVVSSNPDYRAPVLRDPTQQEAAALAQFFADQVEARSDELSRLSNAPRQTLQLPDLELAGYVAGRSLDGRPVDDELLDLLRRVNDANAQTRERLPLGRANVDDDLVRTGRKGYYALRGLRDTWRDQGMTRSPQPHKMPRAKLAAYASAASASGSGNCGEFTAIGMVEQASHMTHGEKLRMLGQGHGDHVFNQVRSGNASVNADAWAYGPAHESVDGTFTAKTGDTVKRMTLKGKKLAGFVSDFDEAAKSTTPLLKPLIDSRAQVVEQEVSLFGSVEAVPALGSGLAQRVQDRVEGRVTEAAMPPAQPNDGERQNAWNTLKTAVLRPKPARPAPGGSLPPPVPDRRRVNEHLPHAQASSLRNDVVVELTAATTARRMGVQNVRSAQRQAVDVIDQARHLRRPNPPGFVRPSDAEA